MGEPPGEGWAEQVGACRGAHHERASGKERLGLTCWIEEDVGDVLGSVPGSGEHPQAEGAELDLVALAEALVGVAEPGTAARPEPGAARRDQFACPGDEVVVHVGLERPGQLDRVAGGHLQVLADVAHRVDDHPNTGVALDDHMGCVPELGASQ